MLCKSLSESDYQYLNQELSGCLLEIFLKPLLYRVPYEKEKEQNSLLFEGRV